MNAWIACSSLEVVGYFASWTWRKHNALSFGISCFVCLQEVALGRNGFLVGFLQQLPWSEIGGLAFFAAFYYLHGSSL